MSADSPVVLVVGAASRDVVDDDPRGWRLGGAVMYVSLALARLGVRVRALVGADREAAGAVELEVLRTAGATVAIVDLRSGPIFDNPRHLLLSTSERIALAALPHAWTTGVAALVIAPVADEVGPDWAELASGEPLPLVGLGWQGLLRVLEAGSPIEPRPPVASSLLEAAHLVVVSEADVAPETRPEAMHALLRPDATLAWTQGADGGQIVACDVEGIVRSTHYPAIPSDRGVDPTGAGDVFLAGMLAARLHPSLGDPVTVAAAAASLTVEVRGLDGVPDLAAVRRRLTRPPSLASR